MRESLLLRPAVAAFLSVLGTGVASASGVYLPPAPGYVLGHKVSQGRQLLVELVPQGESVQRFNRMITLQTMPALGRAGPQAVLGEFARRYTARCPGSRATMLPMGADRGVRIDCGRHPATGRPETVFARALAVGPDMAMVQITMKELAMPRDGTWARSWLGQVRPQ